MKDLVAAEKKPFRFDPPHGVGLRNHAARSAVITIGGQGVKLLLRIVSMSVLARLLTPADYGLVAMATSITAVLGAVREAGLSSATVQRKEITQVQVSVLFWLNVLLGASMFVVAIILSPLAAAFYKQPELVKIIPVFGLLGVIGSLGIQHMALMQRRMEFKKILTRDLAGQITGLFAGIAAARAGAGAWSLVIMEAVALTVSTATIWVACEWRPSKPGKFGEAIGLVKFGSKVMGGALVHHFSKGLDIVILGSLYGNASVGIYGRAQQLLAVPMAQVVTPIMSVARPALSRAAEEPKRMARATSDLLRLISFITAFVVALLVPISETVVVLALGEKWLQAAPIFAGLAPFAIVEPCGALLASVLVATGHPGELLRWRFISVGVIILGIISGITWGTVGVAIAYGLSGLLLRMPLLIWFVARITGIPMALMFNSLVPNLVSAAVAAVSGFAVKSMVSGLNEIFGVTLVLVASAIVYLLCTISSKKGRETLRKAVEILHSMKRKQAKTIQKSI